MSRIDRSWMFSARSYVLCFISIFQPYVEARLQGIFMQRLFPIHPWDPSLIILCKSPSCHQVTKSSKIASNSSLRKGRLNSSVPSMSLRLVIIW